MKIYLNAGHSIEDSGAIPAGKLSESSFAMLIRDLVKIEADNLGLKLELVPDNLNLRQSIDWINKTSSKDDIAVSIHFNANNNINIDGIETYYAKDSVLAETFLRNIVQMTKLTDRGVRHDSETWVESLGWLRQLNCRSVLLECGYLTNYKDYGFLNVPSNQKKLATGILNGIIESIVRQERSIMIDTLESMIINYKMKLIRKKFNLE